MMQLAREAVAQHCGTIHRQSQIYETAAWGREDLQPFLNMALEVHTDQTPLELLHTVLAIEQEMGRQRTEHWGARTLDIDILFYDDHIIDLPELKVPHPYLPQRRFVLAPLCEIAPDLMHPQLHVTVQTLLDGCPDLLPVRVFHTGF